MLLMAGYIYHIIEGKQEVPPVKIKKKCIQTINAVHVLLKEIVIVFKKCLHQDGYHTVDYIS